jgi:hypothetical protein
LARIARVFDALWITILFVIELKLSNQIFFLIFLSSLIARGQADLIFNYKFSDFNQVVKSDISLIFPDGFRTKIYYDTITSYQTRKSEFFTQSGKYSLVFNYSIDNSIIDSIDYGFDINNDETDIEVSIILKQKISHKWVNNLWTETDRKNEGYISIIRYSMPSEFVNLMLDSLLSGDYKAPLYHLCNHSKDTIYGEYLPGYFWGSLSFQNSDSTWSRKLIGTIDVNFCYSPPLLPDSCKIATVGSFGLFNENPKINYRYELLYSKTGNSHGYSKLLINGYTDWWAKTESFFRIIYDYKRQ